MKGLIVFPLITLLLFAVFSMLSGSELGEYNLELSVGGFTFSVDPVGGFIAFISVILVIGSLVGLNVVGSGLSESSIKLIITGAFYLGLWGILSGFAYSLLTKIYLFGTFIYIGLTLMYVVGFIMQYNRSGE